MKSYIAAPSPFARKVRMAALELNLAGKIEEIPSVVAPGKTPAEFKQINPLRKIPALHLDDGSVLLDSTVICEYLDALEGSHKLIPATGPARWQVLTGQSVANGMMEAAVSNRYETFLRPEPHRWDVWEEEQWVKINNALAWFDASLPTDANTIDAIALACALGPEHWP